MMYTGRSLLSLAIVMLALAPIAAPPAAADTGGDAVINPEDQKQLITDWGYDVKQGGKAAALATTFAQTLFVADGITCLRVPIWGNGKRPAHPADGQIVDSFYADILSAMTNARNARPDVVLFASKKLEGKDSFPAWVKDADGVIPARYARLLADFLGYMQARGFTMDILGIDNELEYNEGKITPEKHKVTIDALKKLAAERDFAMPKIIGPDTYGPKADWLKILTAGGWGDRLDIAGTHYYPKWRKPGKLAPWVEAAGARPRWHTEVHWDKLEPPADVLDEAERCFATLFDCADSGFSGFVWWSYNRAGVKGELEQAITQSTVKTRPIAIDDIDGPDATYGELITRAFRGDGGIVVWAINNNPQKRYDNYGFRLAAGAIAGDVAYRQWTATASTAGAATKSDDRAFRLTLPPRTFTKIEFAFASRL